ncbi:MAG TPA: manganese efflux pump MntP family protein [Bacteroidales bacterium]|nr:manganese efflux pump MntP family protein [Bacteroidales bacterium]
MDYLTILAIALGLSFDTFAVSLSYGVVRNGIIFRQASRVALVFAAFQGGLTVAGYFLGSFVSGLLSEADHWIAFGLLLFLGGKMIFEGFREDNEEVKDYGNPFILCTAAVATSIDAFAVGVSLALLRIEIWGAGILIGAVTFLASMTAIRIGKSAGERLGSKVEILGGLMLIGIGIKILMEHLLA